MDKLDVPAAAMNTFEVVVMLGLLESYLESFGSVTERERPDAFRAMQQARLKLRRLLDSTRAPQVST